MRLDRAPWAIGTTMRATKPERLDLLSLRLTALSCHMAPQGGGARGCASHGT